MFIETLVSGYGKLTVSLYDKDTDLDTLPWRDLGALERDNRFPNRTNVQFAVVSL